MNDDKNKALRVDETKENGLQEGKLGMNNDRK